MSKFKKSTDVVLANGGYVSDSSSKDPMTNVEFVKAQQEAHFLVTLAERMKGKTFTSTQGENFSALASEIRDELNSTKTTEFVKTPKAPSQKITDSLAKEALAFMEHVEESEVTNRINDKLQAFAIVNEFEEFGLFFKSGIVKLEKIYTMEEITKAATAVYSVVDNI